MYACSLDDVRAAAERIKPYVHETPVVTSETLSAMAKRSLYFKVRCSAPLIVSSTDPCRAHAPRARARAVRAPSKDGLLQGARSDERNHEPLPRGGGERHRDPLERQPRAGPPSSQASAQRASHPRRQ